MTVAVTPGSELLAQVASIICAETCGLTSECKSREAAKALFDKGYLRIAAKPDEEGVREAQVIPNTDPARQFPLYELMPDFTLRDRDPQADERLKLYRDIFAEITAKATAVSDPTSDDPDRVRYYRIPVGPLHRAAGKLGFHLFNGERHLADAVKEIARLTNALSTTGQPKP
jgi:hypothetical protein